MKKTIAIFLVLLISISSTCFINSSSARVVRKEGSVTIEDVIVLINGIPKIIGYRDTLKPGIERQINILGNDPSVSVQDRQDLRTGYDMTCGKFNLWVDMIKGDLLSRDSLKKMNAAPDSAAYFAKKYLFAYLDAISTYEKQLKPVTDRIQANKKPVDPQMVMLGLEVTVKIVDLIKTWNEQKQFDKENALSILNLSINTLFADKYHMKPWSQLVQLQLPVNTRVGAPVTIQIPVSPAAPVQPLSTQYYVGPDQIKVGLPTLYCPLAGMFYLMKYQGAQTTQIPLTIAASRLTVEYDDYTSGPTRPIDVKTTRFDANLHAGDYFRLHITSGCYVYVFALNPDGTCEPVYPFNNLAGEVAHPLMSRDLTNSFVVPHQNPDSPNGVSMKICKDCAEENLAVIFSRTEFSLQDLMFKASRLSGTLDQRLAALFTNQNLNPTDGILTVQMTDKIQFAANNPAPESVVAFSVHIGVSK